MNFSLTEEQALLKSVAARFLVDHYSFEQRRQRLADKGGFDAGIWHALAHDLGLLGAPLPQDVGGIGGGPVETMLIMEALGEALVIEPYLETVVAGGSLLRLAGGERAADLLSGIVSGDVRIAVAANEVNNRFVLNDVATTAVRDGEYWVLSGAKPVVAAAPSATHLLVSARTSGGRNDRDGISLFVVDSADEALKSHKYRLIDDRPAADMSFDRLRLPADALIGPEGGIFPMLEQAMDNATAALCAEAVGGMRQMLNATIDYTKQRRQFDQTLASFQVLQHRMVDMDMALEQAVSAVYLATLNLHADAAKRRRAVSVAKVTINRSARMIGQNAVQLHGAMGMTDELSVGHYFKRATVVEQTFGSTDHHLARYAAQAAG